MATQFLLTFAIIAIVLPTVTFAAEFLVGDGEGWTTGYDYEGWAKGKEFRVGDKLVFKYRMGLHNVYDVNEDGYKNCIIPEDQPLESGDDKITLEKTGPRYFVCGIGLHCLKLGQKLSVNVKGGDTQEPTKGAKLPSLSPAAKGLPNAAPSQPPAANDSPNVAPSQSSVASDLSNEASPPLAASINPLKGASAPSSSAPNGLGKIGYQPALAVVAAMVAVVVF